MKSISDNNLSANFSPKIVIKPILKWAGGKTQLLKDLTKLVPKYYNKYIEPFFGGGALFFNLQPNKSIISDSNPELINVYKVVATNVKELIEILSNYSYNKDLYYKIRSLKYEDLTNIEAAARTIFLNRTCFNGLYRVNKVGQFNVPFGRYKNPIICDEVNLKNASILLKKAIIVCDDYKNVLTKYASKGDLVYLDPPYLPISKYSDFKRYTKKQFHINDHIELANVYRELNNRECFTILTNSNHPIVHELFQGFNIDIINTKRMINIKGSLRTGEDIIVDNIKQPLINHTFNVGQVKKYPSTRFMGSKKSLLLDIWNISKLFKFDSILDLFSGSGVVGYMYKSQGKEVYSNDYLSMSYHFTNALIENNNVKMEPRELDELITIHDNHDHFVSTNFKELYFSDEENNLIDSIRWNILNFDDKYKKSIALSALIRACMKKRPRGIFTYVGNRYNDGRKDLKIPLKQQVRNAVITINNGIFDNNKKNISMNEDALKLKQEADLIYIDPPYYSPLSDNDYVRRYHFTEGLAKNWKGVEIQENTKTKKFKSYHSPFRYRESAYNAFNTLFSKYNDSIIIVSYSSNSIPTKLELLELISNYKRNVEVHEINHQYSFGNQNHKKQNTNNKVKEYLFVGH